MHCKVCILKKTETSHEQKFDSAKVSRQNATGNINKSTLIYAFAYFLPLLPKFIFEEKMDTRLISPPKFCDFP